MLRAEALVKKPSPKIVSSGGESIVLPEPLFELMQESVEILSKGDAVSIVPAHKELTTQQARRRFVECVSPLSCLFFGKG